MYTASCIYKNPMQDNYKLSFVYAQLKVYTMDVEQVIYFIGNKLIV